MENLVAKVLPLLSGQTALNVELVTNIVSVLRANLTAEQKGFALQVLQAVVTKWRQETKGVTVPYEVEASFELVVAAAFSGDKAAVVADVETVAVSCWDQFLVSLCRKAVADLPAVVQKVEAAVEKSSVPESVKQAVDAVVETVASEVTAAASAVAVSADADTQKNEVNTAAAIVAAEAAKNSATEAAVGVASAVVAAVVDVAPAPAVPAAVPAQEQQLPQPAQVNDVKL